MVIGLSISYSMLNVGQLGFKLSFSLLVKVRHILIDFLEIIENRIKNLSLCHFIQVYSRFETFACMQILQSITVI